MTIPDGIFVGDIELGGMTKEEAGQTIQISEYSCGRKVTLTIEGTPVETTAGELGFAGQIRRQWRKRHLTGQAEI